jgi:hypothetical protein
VNREDEERWLDRAESDPEFAEAVWAGEAPEDEGPAWYPRLARLLGALRTPTQQADATGAGEAWLEVQRRARQRQQRRRKRVVRGIVIGAAVTAGATAAAATHPHLLPAVRWDRGAELIIGDSQPAEPSQEEDEGGAPAPEPPSGVERPCLKHGEVDEARAHEPRDRPGRRCGKAQPPSVDGAPPGRRRGQSDEAVDVPPGRKLKKPPGGRKK